MVNSILVEGNQPAGQTRDHGSQPASWKESLLALGPFLFIPSFSLVGWILYRMVGQTVSASAVLPVFTIIMVLTPLLLFLAAIGVSVARRFPRWTMPYWGLLVILLTYLMQFTGTIAGQEFTGGWWVWLPLVLVAAVGMSIRMNRRQALSDYHTANYDWTNISFAIYGVAPAYLFAAFDEVHDSQLMVASSLLLLAVGALLYMRSIRIIQRVLSLAAGLVLGWGLAALYLANYWGGRQEPWMSQPGEWWGTVLPMVISGSMLLAVMLIPWVISEAIQVVSNRIEPGRIA